MQMGAKGVKIMVAGRLGGSEMSRTEWVVEGSVPLQTLRTFIDYGFAEAFCTYGKIGVKVWVNKGDYLDYRAQQAAGAGGSKEGATWR
jgi:small subunit ribosomal protein S3